jgi:hypothetical protein
VAAGALVRASRFLLNADNERTAIPLTISGQGYRTFSEPRFFECPAQSDITLIEYPVDKAHAIVAAADGSTYAMWKFDSASVAAASSTVIVPLNPQYAVRGRWIKLPSGGGSGGSGGIQSGSGDPEGVANATNGQLYWNTAASPTGQSLWANLATSGTTGWYLLIQL